MSTMSDTDPLKKFFCIAIAFIIGTLLGANTVTSVSQWTITNMWDTCSPYCGPGVTRRMFVCVDVDRFNTTTIRTDDHCERISPLVNLLESYNKSTYEIPCNWGDCDQNAWWQASNWSACSQACGGDGYAYREVVCIIRGSEGDIKIGELFAHKYCQPHLKPASTTTCNRFNCPAEFRASSWMKCEQTDPCKSGVQRRQLSCRSLGHDGSYKELPNSACYMGKKAPPSVWQRCIISKVSALCTKAKPEIKEARLTVVQMRKAGRMNLIIGEEAYVLPSTHLSISCPVTYYSPSNIIWKHDILGEFKYTGMSKASIFVSKSGKLVIRNYDATEKGEWRCYAGDQSSKITLHYFQPSAGYYEWERRNSLRATDMLNEDPRTIMSKQIIVHWVNGPWSNCSVHCGGTGIQTRTVHCEQMGVGLFHILNETECKTRLLPKPRMERECVNLPRCPKWVMRGTEDVQCTDNCIDVGLGTLAGNLTCELGGRNIPEHQCASMDKLDISCSNPECQVRWKTGNWSKCSISCGGVGFKYRMQTCVWEKSGQSAGRLCYKGLLEAPEVVKKCYTARCELDCIDLLPTCRNMLHNCKYNVVKHKCCKSCREKANRGRNVSKN